MSAPRGPDLLPTLGVGKRYPLAWTCPRCERLVRQSVGISIKAKLGRNGYESRTEFSVGGGAVHRCADPDQFALIGTA